MTDIIQLVIEYHETQNPVTKAVLRKIIQKRVLRGEIGRFD